MFAAVSSVAVGGALTAWLVHESEVVGRAWAQQVVAPFGRLGFVLGNVHQGNALISVLALGTCASLVVFAVLYPLTARK